jgi:hypothetical protein
MRIAFIIFVVSTERPLCSVKHTMTRFRVQSAAHLPEGSRDAVAGSPGGRLDFAEQGDGSQETEVRSQKTELPIVWIAATAV